MNKTAWPIISGWVLVGVCCGLFWWFFLTLLAESLDEEPPKAAAAIFLEREQYLAEARAFLVVDNSVENTVNHRLYAVSE